MMKTPTTLLLLAISAFPVFAEESATTRISDLNRAIIASQRAAVQDRPAVVEESVEQKAEAGPTTLSERVAFLTDGKLTVIVPKGAVIYMPDGGVVSVQPEIRGRLVEWNEFLQANHNALRLESVGSDHLMGKVHLTEEVLERVSQSGFPTLTAYQGRVVALPNISQTPPIKP